MLSENCCDNCIKFKPTKDVTLTQLAYDQGGKASESEDPLTRSLGVILFEAGMSGVGRRTCSAVGSGFGNSPCQKPDEFVEKK